MRTSMKSKLLMCASASAMAITAAPAFAQESEELEEIVVTGIRASIESSIAKKRNSTSIVETISAEDIGKLPDVSIAESLARLPGLAAQRLDGRANVISIRGLAPDFTMTTLNGREQVTSNNNRGVELDQYPSELINGATIYKTPDAQLVSQAIGGTIDLQTVKPLQYGRKAMNISGRAVYNDLGKLNPDISNKGYRTSFSYIDQFADDTIGVAFGYARMSDPNQVNKWATWGFPNNGPAGELLIGGVKPFVQSNKLTRDGLMGVVEYQPSEELTTTVDAYYSKFKDNQRLRGIEIPLAWSGAQFDTTNFSVEDGLITDGTFTNVEHVVRNDVTFKDVETIAVGWNTRYQVAERWELEFDASYSKVDREDIAMESYSGTGRGSGNGASDTIGFTLGDKGGMFTHGLDYSDPSLILLAGPQSWGDPLGLGTWDSQDGFINNPTSKDDLGALRLSATGEYDGAIKSVEFGVRHSVRHKSLKDRGLYLTLKDYPAAIPVPAQYLLDPVSLDFIGMGDMQAYDSLGFWEDGNYIETDAVTVDQGRSNNTWRVTEKVSSAYVQANLDTEMGDTPVTGNFGMQAVHTTQSSKGIASRAQRDGTFGRVPVEDGTKYWHFLPSMNLIFDTAEDTKVRFGVARTLARAKMQDMNASRGFGYNVQNINSTDINNSFWNGGGGNPSLKPLTAWQADLSVEQYFGKGGYVSAATFYKKLDGWITSGSTVVSFEGVPSPLPVEPALSDGLISAPVNGEGGKIYGMEFTASVPFNMLSEELDGFGFTGSLSLTRSTVREQAGLDKIQMPGLSRDVFNGTVYYEKHGFQARASVRKRSKFLGEISGLSLTRDTVTVQSEAVFDAQVGYDLSEVGVEGLSILFQVNNLTDEAFVTYHNDDPRQIKDYQSFGRTFLLGLNYKM